MKYDMTAIGKRISKERKSLGLTQSEFAKKLYLSQDSRQTIAKWENGTTLPTLDRLLVMCNIFECELGYLLCEYDCKTMTVTDIHSQTGLSEEAISVLANLNRLDINEVLITLSKIITHDKFLKLLSTIHTHIWDFNKNHFQADTDSVNAIAVCMNCRSSEVKEYMETSSMSVIQTTIAQIVSDIK